MAELQELFEVERQQLDELQTLADAATSSDLRQTFSEHLETTRIHAERLRLLLARQDTPPAAASAAMQAMWQTIRTRIADGERGEVLDAALIGAAQRIEHYEIAVYGCARTYARTLGDREAADLLQQTLTEETDADARLTALAEDGINQAAGEDLRSDADRQRARLRYVPAAQLREFRYREYRVKNVGGEDLGSLDGVIVEPRSLRPRYVVIDSGGWFVGQRYVVPVDALSPDDGEQTLRTDLERQAVEAYPPFNPDAYLPLLSDADQSGQAKPILEASDLMTGVWVTEASGFASVPPRAKSDLVPPKR